VGADESDAAPKAITVETAAQARLGLTVAAVKGAATPISTPATGRVLESSTLLESDSALAAASAGFAASRVEVERLQKAYSEGHSVSRREVEAAREQAQADLQKVNAARRRLAMEWGGGVVGIPARHRAELIDDLSHSRGELVRVEVPAGTPLPRPGSSLELRGNTPADSFAATVLGAMPLIDQPQLHGLLVEVKVDPNRLPVGQTLSVEVPAPEVPGRDGVVLPRGALIRRDADVWAYVQTAPTTFVRRPVRNYKQISTGWFVATGFAPGDRVVATGAIALLGVEIPPAADIGKKVDSPSPPKE
jgi:hypothetical protein